MSLAIQIIYVLLAHCLLAEIWVWRLKRDRDRGDETEYIDSGMSRRDIYAVVIGVAFMSVVVIIMNRLSGKTS